MSNCLAYPGCIWSMTTIMTLVGLLDGERRRGRREQHREHHHGHEHDTQSSVHLLPPPHIGPSGWREPP